MSPERKPRRLRVLCLDIEGGHGGSSRSLYESIHHIDQAEIDIEVWCRQFGPIETKYEAIGIPCRVAPLMPKVSSLPRISRNLYVYSRTAIDFLRARPFLRELVATVGTRFDLVHFNHEALFLLARWLRPRTRVPFTMHLRTNLLPTQFARWQCRTVGKVIDQRVFITANEENTYRLLGGTGLGKVIFNIVRAPDNTPPHDAVPQDSRFRLACLSNYAWSRGTDRLIDIAEALKKQNRRDILFVVAGDDRLSRGLPGQLGRLAAAGGSLRQYAALRGVADYFLFLGHVSWPERVLAACHALVKPTREDNPWGRDVLEAAAQKRLVLTIGHDQTFIENGQTGVVFSRFDTEQFTSAIVNFADDRGRTMTLAEAAQRRVLSLCDGHDRSDDLLRLWQSVKRAPA